MDGKTNFGLVEFCESYLNTPYCYGCKNEVLTAEKYANLRNMYGSGMVLDSDKDKIGRICCDCSGLISTYTGILRGSSQYKAAALEIRPIGTISQAPLGALVWKDGHIGVYVGMENGQPMYIAEDGSKYGCRKAKLPGVFTHWFLCPDIEYLDTTGQKVTQAATNGHGGVSGHHGGGDAGGKQPPTTVQSGIISPGDAVRIKPGAVYGGLSVDRGKDVPTSVIGRPMTVDKIAAHRGVKEALLYEIFSWVAVEWLEKV